MLLLAGVLITLLQLHHHVRYQELISSTDVELRRIQMVIMPIIAPVRESNKVASPNTPPLRELRNRPPFDDTYEGERGELQPRPERRLPPPGADRPEDRNRAGINESSTENSSDPLAIGREFLDHIVDESVYVISWSLTTHQEEHRFGKVPEDLTFETYANPDNKGRNTYTYTRAGYRELLIIQGNRRLIIIGCPLTQVNSRMSEIRQEMFLIGISIFLFALLSGRIIINRGLRPIDQVSATAREIAEGNRSNRIMLSDAPEEMEGMAMTLNATFDSLGEAIKRQARFTADASHELRTPIAVIIAQTQATLRKERTPEQYISTLNACLRAGLRMKTLSESLLDLTRIDAQSLALDKRVCELGPTLSDAAELANEISGKHNVEYTTPGTSIKVTADKDRIHQTVVNLISNAIRYNPDGCRVEVSLEKREESAIIKVSDNGVGIPPEHLPHIFERFYRIDKSRSRASGGSGLGLSIVQNIVEAHHGTITAESTPGKETTFTITLPEARS